MNTANQPKPITTKAEESIFENQKRYSLLCRPKKTASIYKTFKEKSLEKGNRYFNLNESISLQRA